MVNFNERITSHPSTLPCNIHSYKWTHGFVKSTVACKQATLSWHRCLPRESTPSLWYLCDTLLKTLLSTSQEQFMVLKSFCRDLTRKSSNSRYFFFFFFSLSFKFFQIHCFKTLEIDRMNRTNNEKYRMKRIYLNTFEYNSSTEKERLLDDSSYFSIF